MTCPTQHIHHVLKWVLCVCSTHRSVLCWRGRRVLLSPCVQGVPTQSCEMAEIGRKRRKSGPTSQAPGKMRKIQHISSPQKTSSGVVSQFGDLSFLPGSFQWSQTLELCDLLKHIQHLVEEVAEVSA